MLVSVIIPCLNAGRSVERLVASLAPQRLPEGVSMEIVVVDNGSLDDSLDILKKLDVQLCCEDTPGPAAARNRGVEVSRGDIIVFMDADTRAVDSSFIKAHLRALADKKVAVSGGAITHDPEQKSILAFAENATALFNWHDRLPARSQTFQPTGNMAFRKELFDMVGPLDESLLWLEDFEWNTRVVQAGLSICFDPAAAVYIRGRESLPDILRKFYRWGLNVRSVYLPGRRSQFWIYPDSTLLFMLNAPLRVLNESWVTVKRWIRVHPLRILILIPVFLLFRTAWGFGMVAGAGRVRK